jgi:hypothetical protein
MEGQQRLAELSRLENERRAGIIGRGLAIRGLPPPTPSSLGMLRAGGFPAEANSLLCGPGQDVLTSFPVADNMFLSHQAVFDGMPLGDMGMASIASGQFRINMMQQNQLMMLIAGANVRVFQGMMDNHEIISTRSVHGANPTAEGMLACPIMAKIWLHFPSTPLLTAWLLIKRSMLGRKRKERYQNHYYIC